MDYNYEVYLEKGKEKTMSEVADALKGFNIAGQTELKLTLLFGDDWELCIEWMKGAAVSKRAKELAEEHALPVLKGCSARLEITSDNDVEELHYNDHLYVLDYISAIEGMHIYDPILDEFLYEEVQEREIDPNLDLGFLDALEDQPAYMHLVMGLRKRPHDVESWEELQYLLEDEGNPAFALLCLHNIMVLAPSDFVGWFNTGILYRDQEEYDKAEVYFRKVTEIEPDFSDAWADLGKLCFRKGKVEEGIEYINKAIAVKPDNELPYINAGYYLVKLGEPAKALEYSEAGIAYDAYCCTFNKAHALLALKRSEEAIDCYQKSLQAADSEADFKADFKADFELFEKYQLPKKEYLALLGLVLDV